MVIISATAVWQIRQKSDTGLDEKTRTACKKEVGMSTADNPATAADLRKHIAALNKILPQVPPPKCLKIYTVLSRMAARCRANRFVLN